MIYCSLVGITTERCCGVVAWMRTIADILGIMVYISAGLLLRQNQSGQQHMLGGDGLCEVPRLVASSYYNLAQHH